jgi:drug/metabolite transporter superfamily protein YnfA
VVSSSDEKAALWPARLFSPSFCFSLQVAWRSAVAIWSGSGYGRIGAWLLGGHRRAPPLPLWGGSYTFQPAHFGRVYAAYGGVFVVLSILWGWWIDGTRPDRRGIVGAGLFLIGVGVIMYWPRG